MKKKDTNLQNWWFGPFPNLTHKILIIYIMIFQYNIFIDDIYHVITYTWCLHFKILFTHLSSGWFWRSHGLYSRGSLLPWRYHIVGRRHLPDQAIPQRFHSSIALHRLDSANYHLRYQNHSYSTPTETA